MLSRFRLFSAGILILGVLPLLAAADGRLGRDDSGRDDTARLATYKADEGTAFALSLALKGADGERLPADVVVVVDTSVTQVGLFHEDSCKVVEQMLSQLGPNDRVRIFAVDLDLVPLHDDFATVRDPAVGEACAKLAARSPLGSTDMAKLLAEVPALFAGRDGYAHNLVFIGDGISRGGLVPADKFAALVQPLIEQRISVSSLAIGPERDVEFLAALANHTGGNIYVDSDEAGSVAAAGNGLAQTVQGSVFWPTDVQASAAFREFYPVQLPPLRSDRDSIVIGMLGEADVAGLQVSGVLNGQPFATSWDLQPEPSDLGLAFLPRLLENVRGTQGMPLATVGSAGLLEFSRLLGNSSEVLTALSAQALSVGDRDGAAHLVNAALKADPTNVDAAELQTMLNKEPVAAAGAATKAAVPVAAPVQPAVAPAPPAASGSKSGSEKPAAAGIRAPLVLGTPAPPRRQEPAADESVATQEQDADTRFMQDERERITAAVGRMKADVENSLRSAREEMSTGPEKAVARLKDMLDVVDRDPILDSATRAALQGQLQKALITANGKKYEVEEKLAQQRQNAARRAETERLYRDMVRREEQIAALLNRFNALMLEKNYTAASDIPQQVLDLGGDLPAAHSIEEMLPIAYNFVRMWQLRRDRQLGFFDQLLDVENSLVPFGAEPPLKFPDAEVWAEKVAMRKKYSTVRWSFNPRDEAILSKLNDVIGEWDFEEAPFSEVIEKIADEHGITVTIDEDSDLTADTPITFKVSGIRLRSALKLLLKQHDSTYVVKDEVMRIIGNSQAQEELVTYVYNVGDLVFPRTPLGGGFGGGLGGGGLGGGGFGGGGLGGGGQGGGGFGGGQFAVQDQLEVGQKSAPNAAAAPRKPRVLEVSAAEGPARQEAWRKLLQTETIDPADIRETVRALMKKGDVAQVTEVVYAAMATGVSEPWMYEALVLALQIQGAPASEIERAVMSSVDLTGSLESALSAAKYMADNKMESRAIALLRDLAITDPLRAEPYVLALAAAQRISQLDGIEWATLGVLGQAWPEHREIVANALKAAKALEMEYQRRGETEKLNAFIAKREEALFRDCVIEVAWTGQADLDLYVEEPGGSVCCRQMPRTIGGGVLMGDAAANPKSDGESSEYYVLPKGFSGQYRLMIHRVWGEVPSGKATITIHRHFRAPSHTWETRQVPLSQEGAVVLFQLEDGRRTEGLDAEKLANLIQEQQVLAEEQQNVMQELAKSQSDRAKVDYLKSRPDAPEETQDILNEANDPSLRRGAPGYQPNIIVLPSGTSLRARAATADRLHVMISPAPAFTSVTNVETFTFQGLQTGGGGGLGGGGLGGGGLGGGGGGLGGGGAGGGGGLGGGLF